VRVAPASFAVAVTPTLLTLLATLVLYEVVPVVNAGERVPPLTDNPLRVASFA
jgi:hypothetical protein